MGLSALLVYNMGMKITSGSHKGPNAKRILGQAGMGGGLERRD